jgi:hypothetical protein
VSASQTITLTNTGTTTIHVGAAFATSDFAVQTTCATVVAGGTCAIAVSARPQTPGVHVASLEIASDSATSLEFASLTGTAAPSVLAFSPASLDFGSLLVGTTATLPVQVTNTGANPAVFSAISATGDYTVAAGSCPSSGSSLAANSSCTVQVTFMPTTAGTRTGALAFATSASTNPLTVALTGVGTQSQLIVTPSALVFANIVVGVPATLSLTLSNTGTAPITNLSLAASGDYSVSVPCPLTTLLAGASCTIQVSFVPTAVGTRPGTLTVLSSDPGSPRTIPLTGTGIQGGGFLMTVNGSNTASVSVTSGLPATYQLAITPTGGFSGAVALTCAPITAAQYATCSLLSSTLTLAGGTQTSVATINTITSAGSAALRTPSRGLQTIFFCLLFPGLWTIWKGRRQLRRRRILLLALLFAASSMFALGCGGGGGQFNTLYTPPGTYQYQVTASSTSGIPTTQTVTLNLTVTSR